MFLTEMNTLKTIMCTGKDGVTRKFEYEDPEPNMDSESEVHSWTYLVKEHLEDPECFQFTVEESDENSLKVTGMHNNGFSQYTAKGIPEAMIMMTKLEFAKSVHSSSNRKPESGEFRSVPADKIWKRLEARAEAVYDESQDIFRTTA